MVFPQILYHGVCLRMKTISRVCLFWKVSTLNNWKNKIYQQLKRLQQLEVLQDLSIYTFQYALGKIFTKGPLTKTKIFIWKWGVSGLEVWCVVVDFWSCTQKSSKKKTKNGLWPVGSLGVTTGNTLNRTQETNPALHVCVVKHQMDGKVSP